jgi:hypothetical protein
MDLKTLLAEAGKHTDSAARQAAIRAVLAQHPEFAIDALAAFEAQAVSEFDQLAADDKTDLDTLRTHADLIKAVRAEKQDRTAAPAPAQPQPAAPAAPAPADAGQATPAAPATTAETTAPAPQETPPMDTPTAPAGTDLVAASATRTVLKPAEVPMPWEAMPFDTANNSSSSYVITAAAGAPGVEAGEEFDDFGRLAKLLSNKFESLGRGMSEPSQMMLASARPEDWSNAYSNITRASIAALGFQRDHDFVMQHQHDWQVIERACNESRLPGGTLTPTPSSLTAAPGTPGWCAPCEVRYDFCPPAVLDGIVDLPTVIATRGCLTYPQMPDFGLLYQGAGFCYPAADYDDPADPDPTVTGPKNKPCMLVPCPETQTCTLDPCGVCLQSSILVERAYPELIQYFIANALVAWGHKMNCRDLTQMITQSTAVDLTADAVKNRIGPGATASVLEVLEFYATWLKYKYRLGRNASIEAVLPDWLKGVIRSDLSKRMGLDLLSVTDQMIDNWLTLRKIRVQWVLGLDEAFCDAAGVPAVQIDPKTSLKMGGNVSALGQTTPSVIPPTLWPRQVSFLIYPAGTFFRARLNLVNIEGGLVDSTLLKRNERLLLFMEEASVVCKRCYESVYVTMNICPSGQTGGGSVSQPDCEDFTPPPPPPTVTITEDLTDSDRMTVSMLVDNDDNGPVTIAWGQTPPLANKTNPGDGTTATTQKYTQDGTWTVTITPDDGPPVIQTVTLPYGGGLTMTLNVVDTVPPSRNRQATWDNQGQGSVKLWWGDESPAGPGIDKPEAGNATHTYAAAGTYTVRVQDATTPTRFRTQTITVV